MPVAHRAALLLAATGTGGQQQAVQQEGLEKVADFGWSAQPTGVAVSTGGRSFVTFPRWFQNHTGPSVAEVVDGQLVPYPDARWNTWRPGDEGSDRFVCVQSVFIDHFDRLWILDPAAAFLGNVTDGAPKLLLVNLTTDTVEKVIHFPPSIAPPGSYLNDIRVSRDGRHGFLTDSNLGGLRVVDLRSGGARALLGDHASTHAEGGVVSTVEGQEMRMAATGGPATFQSDGIAVLGDTLYYHAVTARTLYSVPVALMVDPSRTGAEVAAGVREVATSGIPDGLVAAADARLNGVLYMTAIEKDGIDQLSDDGYSRVLPFVSDARLQWPDSMSVPVLRRGRANYLYVTASQVNAAPFIKDPRPRRNTYAMYRVRIPERIVARYASP